VPLSEKKHVMVGIAEGRTTCALSNAPFRSSLIPLEAKQIPDVDGDIWKRL
jgi:hypothetical protein